METRTQSERENSPEAARLSGFVGFHIRCAENIATTAGFLDLKKENRGSEMFAAVAIEQCIGNTRLNEKN